MIGWSNGGSTTLLTMNADHEDAKDARLHELNLPELLGAIVYYPGCGLYGQLTFSLDEEDLDSFYYPRGPVLLLHAGEDDLVENCEEVRDPQVELVASELGVVEDMFDLKIYADAEHGFDSPDEDDEDDVAAREAARELSLATLEQWLD